MCKTLLGLFAFVALCDLLSISTSVKAQVPERLTFGKVTQVGPDGTIHVRSGTKKESLPLLGAVLPLPDQPGNPIAFAALAKLLHQKEVYYAVQELGGKKYLRLKVGMTWANLAMIEAGAAWHDPKQIASDALAQAQETARKNKVGLWALPDPIAPWEWPEKRDAFAKKTAEAAAIVRAKVWEEAKEKIPAAERAEAVALLNKAIDAMGGEAKLAGLKRVSCQLEVTAKDPQLFTVLLWPILQAAPPAQADALKLKISAWWEGKERGRFDLTSSPEAKFLLDQRLSVRFSGSLLPDNIFLVHRLRDAAGSEKLFADEQFKIKPEHLKQRIEGMQAAMEAVQSFWQLFPCLGPDYLLRKAPPRANDPRPAILVASRKIFDAQGGGEVSWLRIYFNGDKGWAEELSVEADPLQRVKLANYREINGLTHWTKMEVVYNGADFVTIEILDLQSLAGPIAELSAPAPIKTVSEVLKEFARRPAPR